MSRERIVLLLTGALQCSCGGFSLPKGPPPPAPVEYAKDEGNAMEIAESIVGGEVSVLVHTDRVRAHPHAWGITRLAGWEITAETFGFDPLFDVDRAFITAPRFTSCQSALVLRHHLSEWRVYAGFARARKEAGAKPLKEPPAFPAVEVKIGRTRRLVAAPSAGLLVVMPPYKPADARRFIGSGRIPGAIGDEAWAIWASGSSVPFGMSLTLAGAVGTVSLGPLVSVRVEGFSSTQAGAEADATLLTRSLEKALRIPGIGMHVFTPVEFRAEREYVRGETTLHPSELSWVLAMAIDHC